VPELQMGQQSQNLVVRLKPPFPELERLRPEFQVDEQVPDRVDSPSPAQIQKSPKPGE